MQYVIVGKLEKIEITEERKSPIFLNNLEIAVVNILEFGLPELSFSRLLFFSSGQYTLKFSQVNKHMSASRLLVVTGYSIVWMQHSNNPNDNRIAIYGVHGICQPLSHSLFHSIFTNNPIKSSC